MKTPTNFDVFCNTNFLLKSKHLVVNGNFYINGDADSERIKNTLEVFGDLIVDGYMYIGYVTVHGNLICDKIISKEITVDGDVIVAGEIRTDSLVCNSGDIILG